MVSTPMGTLPLPQSNHERRAGNLVLRWTQYWDLDRFGSTAVDLQVLTKEEAAIPGMRPDILHGAIFINRVEEDEWDSVTYLCPVCRYPHHEVTLRFYPSGDVRQCTVNNHGIPVNLIVDLDRPIMCEDCEKKIMAWDRVTMDRIKRIWRI